MVSYSHSRYDKSGTGSHIAIGKAVFCLKVGAVVVGGVGGKVGDSLGICTVAEYSFFGAGGYSGGEVCAGAVFKATLGGGAIAGVYYRTGECHSAGADVCWGVGGNLRD